MARATIDRKSCEFEDNSRILDAARSLGIEVPTLCHDECLKPKCS
jgi:NADH dehydrogenase/NADH:ubiquinone oxidoreductase subunit G